MKRLLAIAMIAACCLLLCACERDGRLAGTWSGVVQGFNEDTREWEYTRAVIELRDDGFGRYAIFDSASDIRWQTADDDILVLTILKGATFRCNYTVTGDTLDLIFEDGLTETYTRR